MLIQKSDAYEPAIQMATADTTESRILICVDESPMAEKLSRAVASRIWPKGTEVRLLTVVDPFDYSIVDLLNDKIKRVERLHRALANEFDETPLYISSVIKEGDPEKIILREAEDWGATSIFIGTSGKSMMRRILMGSLSTAVTLRAKCPVELVKNNEQEKVPTGLLHKPSYIHRGARPV